MAAPSRFVNPKPEFVDYLRTFVLSPDFIFHSYQEDHIYGRPLSPREMITILTQPDSPLALAPYEDLDQENFYSFALWNAYSLRDILEVFDDRTFSLDTAEKVAAHQQLKNVIRELIKSHRRLDRRFLSRIK